MMTTKVNTMSLYVVVYLNPLGERKEVTFYAFGLSNCAEQFERKYPGLYWASISKKEN